MTDATAGAYDPPREGSTLAQTMTESVLPFVEAASAALLGKKAPSVTILDVS